MSLVDFAADVWRVERPNHTVGTKGTSDCACSFERAVDVGKRDFNRNKKSIVLELRSEEAREIFCKMAKGLGCQGSIALAGA